MDKQTFDQIYVNHKEKVYSADTIDSVHRCYKTYEQKSEVLEYASKYRKPSAKKAIEDVEDFFNCLKRCYSGYDYFFTDEMCVNIQRTIKKKIRFRIGRVSNRELVKLLYNSLKDIINDCHFEIYASGVEYHLSKKYIAYVADVVVRKAHNGYEVVRGDLNFSKGYLMKENDVKKYLMPTIYFASNIDKNDKCYLLGIYSDRQVKEIKICGKNIKTHRILSDMATQDQKDRLELRDGYVVANHDTYNMPLDGSLMSQFYNEGECCSKSANVILNLAGNRGGSSSYPGCFYNGLCGVSDNGFSEAALPMPYEINTCEKKYEINLSKSDDIIRSSYSGKLYVVMNKATGSSAEMAVSSAYNLKNVIVVGSGSCGCGNFGECLLYQLPNSGIIFYCGHKLFHHDKFDEGRGFLPDYWIDDKDPVGIIETVITYHKTKGE